MSNKLNIKFEYDFTIVPNQIFRDNRLTLKAKGLYLTILSVSEEWNFSIAGLAKLAKDSTTAIKTGIQELEKYGYLEWLNYKDDDGKFAVEVNIYLPDLDTLYTGIPQVKSSTSENRTWDIVDNKEINNKESNLYKESNINNALSQKESNLTDKNSTSFTGTVRKDEKLSTRNSSGVAQEYKDKDNNKDIILFEENFEIEKPEKKKTISQEIWDALCEVLNYSQADITDNVRGQLNRAVKQFKSIGVSPDQIRERAPLYRIIYADCAFTPTALINRWAELKPENSQRLLDKSDRDRFIKEESKQRAKEEEFERMKQNLIAQGIIGEDGEPIKQIG